MNVNEMVERFGEWYGDGEDGAAPRPDQWRRILERDPAQPVTLINFFKFHRGSEPGHRTFGLYSQVSMPKMQQVGGQFLVAAPSEGSLIGPDEDWDLVVVGSYPNLDAFMELYIDEEYRAAFAHRVAACERQKVMVAAA